MNQRHSIRMIIDDNKLKQKEFAASLAVTESYVSKLLKDPNINVSDLLLGMIEERFGYNPDWIVNGSSPMYSNTKRLEGLSDAHKRLIAELEKMSPPELMAVEAFMDSLRAVKKSFDDTTPKT